MKSARVSLHAGGFIMSMKFRSRKNIERLVIVSDHKKQHIKVFILFYKFPYFYSMEKVQEVKISVLKTSKRCSKIASKYSNFHLEHHTNKFFSLFNFVFIEVCSPKIF